MQPPERTIAVLFTDIAGYTGFVSSKGSSAAMEMLRQHNTIVKPVLEQFGGTYVKSTGDGIIAYFERCRPAVEAAVVIQQRLAAYNMGRSEDQEIHIRIGLHIGTAIPEPGEIIGHAVNFAARLVAVCHRDQILTSKEVHKKVAGLKHLSFKRVGYTNLQGIPRSQEVFEVCWDITRLEPKDKAVAVAGNGASGTRRRLLYVLVVLIIGLTLGLLWVKRGRVSQESRGKFPSSSATATDLFRLAQSYSLKGDDEQALTALDEAISTDPTFSEAYLEAAEICHDIGEEGKAREYAQKAQRLSSSLTEPSKLKLKGLTFELDGDMERALQSYQLLVDQHPEDTEGHTYLAAAAASMGRLDEAELSLNNCLEREPKNPYCHYYIMMLQVRRNKFDSVLSAYESIHRQGVEYPWFDEAVGMAFWGKDQLEEASRQFERLSRARAGSVRMHGTVHFEIAKEWLADIALYQGRLTDARNRIEQLLEGAQSPDVRASYLVYLSKIDAFLGDQARAESHARMALSDSTDPATRIEAAKVLGQVGNAEEAAKALALPPDANVGKRNPSAEHSIQGSLALAHGDARKAIQELSLALEMSPDPETMYLLAKAHMAAAEWRDAVRQLEAVRASKGSIIVDYVPLIWPLAHYYLGECHERLGNNKEASEYYGRFLELWRTADADLRPLLAAKKRLGALSVAKK